MNKGKNLTVIVVTHDRLDYTRRTLESLFRTVPDAKFLIIDNNSTELGMNAYLETLPFTRSRELGDILFMSLVANIGWGAAVNIALYEIKNKVSSCGCGKEHDMKSEYILISNNDVEYSDGWYEKCLESYNKHSDIGIFGVWKHIAHGVLEDRGDIVVKDQMPAVGWVIRPEVINDIGNFKEKGPCETKGGNGEDVNYCIRAVNKGYIVCGPKEDIATHIDGY